MAILPTALQNRYRQGCVRIYQIAATPALWCCSRCLRCKCSRCRCLQSEQPDLSVQYLCQGCCPLGQYPQHGDRMLCDDQIRDF